MALTIDKLVNDERFSGDNFIQFLLFLPFGLVLLAVRSFLVLILWIASIILPKKSSFRHLLSILACLTFGVYVKLKGKRDPRCSLLVANYVSALDSLAVSHTLGTICLRKWKMPPFFASALGITNAAQFVRKEHFADSPRKPVLLQPEGGPTNGKGLLQFTDWPFQIGNRVQPVAITVERMFTAVSVHESGEGGGSGSGSGSIPTRDLAWYLCGPWTRYHVTVLPPLERGADDDRAFVERVRAAIADALQVECTPYRWEELSRRRPPPAPRTSPSPSPSRDVTRLALQVREVLPRVPLHDILRDLAKTRSVDVTITNFLEGLVHYTPEPELEPAPTTSQAPPKYITPTPTGVFPKNAKERQLSFQERKNEMIAAARRRYIEKHGLEISSC